MFSIGNDSLSPKQGEGRSGQRRRYRQRHPDKIREQKRKYLERKFRKNPKLMEKLKGRIHGDFCKLTRLMFGDILPEKCEICGTDENLEIHHKKYSYPIMRDDLMRLCKRHHIEEHQKAVL